MNIQVTARGDVARTDIEKLKRELADLENAVAKPVLGIRAVLTEDRNPRRDRPSHAEAQVDVNGTPVYARVNAGSMSSAVDELSERMARHMRRHVDRQSQATRRAPLLAEPGEWLHGAERAPQPEAAWRPPGERRIVRRKSFTLRAIDSAAALAEMATFDHNFHLYLDAETGADAVAYNRDDGRLGVIVPRGTEIPLSDGPVWEDSRNSEALTERDAIAEMDELGHRFLYFVNAATGRGNVIYLRFDGHYGLIEPAG
jgi:ribosome-associated translation inhibitor RaiA